jgi:flagellar biosynthetic protein FlhB
MAETDGDKTQDATPHRRQQAREEGQVAKSQDLASAALLLAGLAGLLWLGGPVVEMLARYAVQQLSSEAWLSTDPQFFVAHAHQVAYALATCMLPIFGLLMFMGIAANFLQVGFLFVPEKLAPDLMRLDPLQGLARLFSLQNLVRLLMGLLKMALVAAVAYVSLYGQREKVLGLTAMSAPQIAGFLAQVLIWTSIKIAMALLVLAILDYGFQWWKHERDLRMTTQEVREELKNLEANPQMVARRKQVQRQLALHRISTAVPKADAVITNPTELAIAIQYDPQTMAAPIVVAKGAGLIAAQIRKLALENGVPILERKPLAQALYREVEVDHPIPQDRYAAVAEVLAYVYQLKGKKIPTPAKHTGTKS